MRVQTICCMTVFARYPACIHCDVIVKYVGGNRGLHGQIIFHCLYIVYLNEATATNIYLLLKYCPPSLSTTACPGPPLDPRLTSPVPPSVEIWWDRPATPDMWSFMYMYCIDWQNGTSPVGDTEDMHVNLTGLEAVTQYEVTITAFTDSTLCAGQSVNFTFNTTESEYWFVSALHQGTHVIMCV